MALCIRVLCHTLGIIVLASLHSSPCTVWSWNGNAQKKRSTDPGRDLPAGALLECADAPVLFVMIVLDAAS